MSSRRRSTRRNTLPPILENENYVPNNTQRKQPRPVNFSVRRKKGKNAKGTQKYGRRNKLVHPQPIVYNNENESFESLAARIGALKNF